jgi:hypothetical protein
MDEKSFEEWLDDFIDEWCKELGILKESLEKIDSKGSRSYRDIKKSGFGKNLESPISPLRIVKDEN